jgi:hypothetical protein
MMRRLHHFPGLFFIFRKLGRHCRLQVLPIFRTVIELAEAIKPIALICRSEATGPFTDEHAYVDYFLWLHLIGVGRAWDFSSPLKQGTSNGMTNDDDSLLQYYLDGVAAGGGAHRTSVSASHHYFFKVEDEWNLAFSI